jgi:hypothetical protein
MRQCFAKVHACRLRLEQEPEMGKEWLELGAEQSRPRLQCLLEMESQRSRAVPFYGVPDCTGYLPSWRI